MELIVTPGGIVNDPEVLDLVLLRTRAGGVGALLKVTTCSDHISTMVQAVMEQTYQRKSNAHNGWSIHS